MEEERISQLGKSETVIEQNIKSLKQLFPQVFTEDKINFSLLEDLLGEKIEDKRNITNFHGQEKVMQEKNCLKVPPQRLLL